ncbi:hypothetical protein B9G69_010190 [Bdellovibrio sp. SKB1291214]|uniref:hypothetical protein n=1 Tax=Bdellovibrio sp. SKB1291214 TaxID=1732569 RepID=UPI000B72429C|nr:hypothetical protein [Bdellovibrio sp. SKB1291214]UYL07414.1 hypothetical protein B9G69_010190 [Bdellovibrio sp. SKB1291214]
MDGIRRNIFIGPAFQILLIHAWLDWKKKKTGIYPAISEQKRILQTKHNGILLEAYAPSQLKSTYQVRHKFLLNKQDRSAEEKKANTR